VTALVVFAVDPACHDYHAGAGDLAVARAALAAAHGGPRLVETPLTRSNYRALAAMPATLRAWGATAWRLRVLRASDAPADGAPRWVPRLAVALPHALHAADRALRLGLPTTLVGAPRCLLGPLAHLDEPTLARAFAPSCATCLARATCAGVDADYLARFGPGELAPQR
jgi:hypothetical protein